MIGQLSSDREFADWIATVRVTRRRVREHPRISAEERALRAYDAETARMLNILHQAQEPALDADHALPRVVKRKLPAHHITDWQLELAIRVYDQLPPERQARWASSKKTQSERDAA